MFKIIFSIFLYYSIQLLGQDRHLSISGRVINSSTNEPLENCNIYIKSIEKGATTDSDGIYKLRVESGFYQLLFSYIGFKSAPYDIAINDKSVLLDVALEPIIITGKEVEIIAEREHAEIITQKIVSKDVQKMPTIYSDVLRSVQVLSGVSTNTELSSGYNVRGGSYDENLIYLNGYEIYRPFLLRVGVEENQSTINPHINIF